MLDRLLSTPGVREIHIPRGPVGMMALHGGLEHGTFDIAATVAERSGASLYAVVQPDDLFWHVPSISYDPGHSEALAGFLADISLAVSIHGFGRREMVATALIGGRNEAAGRRIAAELGGDASIVAIAERDAIPPKLRGVHPRNPVNAPSSGGVQIELTPDLRRPPARERVTDALAGIVASFVAEASDPG